MCVAVESPGLSSKASHLVMGEWEKQLLTVRSSASANAKQGSPDLLFAANSRERISPPKMASKRDCFVIGGYAVWQIPGRITGR